MINYDEGKITPSDIDPALARFLEDRTHEALNTAMSKLEVARSRFNEATGRQVDAACLEMLSAECELRAIYARYGNTLTPEKDLLIKQLLSSGTDLRLEFQIPRSAS